MGSKRHRNPDKALRLEQRRNSLNQYWSDVDNLYNSIANGLVDVSLSINNAIQSIKEAEFIDTKELVITINGLKSDIETFTQDLIKINNRHKGKEGLIQDEDELALCLSVANDYIILNDRFKALIFPPMITITEYVSEAIRLKKQKDNLALTQEESV